MDFLGDSSTSAALDVVFFVREMCETHPALVPSVLERLRDNFATIRASRVCTCALWVLSEFSSTVEEVRARGRGGPRGVGGDDAPADAGQLQHRQRRLRLFCACPCPCACAWPGPARPRVRRRALSPSPQPPTPQVRAAIDTISEGLGPLPLLPAPTAEDGNDAGEAKDAARAAAGAPPASVGSKRPAVLADGTYASQAAVLEAPLPAAGGAAAAPNLRALLLGGDFFLGGVVAAALTKLVLRLRALGAPRAAANRAAAQAMLSIASILRLGEWEGLPAPLDDDSRDRMVACLDVLARPTPETVKVRPFGGGSGGAAGAGREGGACLGPRCVQPVSARAPQQPLHNARLTPALAPSAFPNPAVAGRLPPGLCRADGGQAQPRGRGGGRGERQGGVSAGRPHRLLTPARAEGAGGARTRVRAGLRAAMTMTMCGAPPPRSTHPHRPTHTA